MGEPLTPALLQLDPMFDPLRLSVAMSSGHPFGNQSLRLWCREVSPTNLIDFRNDNCPKFEKGAFWVAVRH
jgi:hypothetical protein